MIAGIYDRSEETAKLLHYARNLRYVRKPRQNAEQMIS